MKILVLLMCLSGCQLVFGVEPSGIEYIYPPDSAIAVDGALDGSSSDGSTDAPSIDASLDASTDAPPGPAQIEFTYDVAQICTNDVIAGRLRLSAPPDAPLTITITSSDPGKLSIDPPTSYSFNAADWATPRDVWTRASGVSAPNVEITAAAQDLTPVARQLAVIDGCP